TANDPSRAAIEAQTKIAIDQAHVIVLLLDVRQGLTPLDRDIARLLRRSGQRVIVAANKADSPSERHFAHELLELGFDEPNLVSAQHGIGVGDLLDRVVGELPPAEEGPAGHVAGDALGAGKGLVIVVNKIDLVEPAKRLAAYWQKALAPSFKFATYAPVVAVSAKTKEGIGGIVPVALEVVGQRRIKMPTNELNKVLRQAFVEHPPPSYNGRRLRFGYATQAKSEAPTVVLFVNDTGLLH